VPVLALTSAPKPTGPRSRAQIDLKLADDPLPHRLWLASKLNTLSTLAA
jgi:hypothetical protein